ERGWGEGGGHERAEGGPARAARAFERNLEDLDRGRGRGRGNTIGRRGARGRLRGETRHGGDAQRGRGAARERLAARLLPACVRERALGRLHALRVRLEDRLL